MRSGTLADCRQTIMWAPSSEFVSSSIPSWQILTAHAQPFRGARDLAFCLNVPLDSLLVWASSGGSGETARMRRLAWTFAARIGDKYQIRLTRLVMLKAVSKLNYRVYGENIVAEGLTWNLLCVLTWLMHLKERIMSCGKRLSSETVDISFNMFL